MHFRLTLGLLGFIFGTLILWICSYTVNTPNTDIKTSAIYNAIQQVLGLVFAGVMLSLKPVNLGEIIVEFSIFYLISFFLLKKLYGTSIFGTIWLATACWAAREGADKFITAIL
jgi:hypothetical protein